MSNISFISNFFGAFFRKQKPEKATEELQQNIHHSKCRLGSIRLRWVILLLLFVFVRVIMSNDELGEWYSRSFYPRLSVPLSYFSAFFPFSLGDCFIYGSILGLLFYFLYVCIKRRNKKKALICILEFLGWVYVWFYLAWGLNYFRQSFFVRMQIHPVTYSKKEFHSFLSVYTDSLNASSIGAKPVDSFLIESEIKKGYSLIYKRFGLNKPEPYLHPKSMLVAPLMSKVGVLGYMGPFFIEYNLNPDLLPVQYPFTYAHELAHVLGIANEAEANLYGFLVCSQSMIPHIRFSAHLALLPYVIGNAHQLLSKEEFGLWVKTISPQVKDIYNQKTEYWESLYSPLIGDIQDRLYSFFLKSNNIPTGQKNYSEVIALLMSLRES